MKVKNLVFSGAMASILMMGATNAMAEINVTPGDTDITSGVVDAIKSSINHNPAFPENYGYTAPDGETEVKLSDTTQYTADDYKTGSTSKDNTVISGPESVNWNSSLTADNYSFKLVKADGSEGDVTTGGATYENLTTTVARSQLNRFYTGEDLTLNSVGGTESPQLLDYSTDSGGNMYYLFKVPDGLGEKYALTTDADNPTDHIIEDPVAEGVSGLLHDLSAAYEKDIAAVSAIQETLNKSNQKNLDNFDLINNATTGFLAQDTQKQIKLAEWENSLEIAKAGFTTAQSAYTGTVAEAIDSHILNKDGAVAKLFNEKEAWVGEQLGYDTTTTDAKTKLAKAGFESTDFLGAVTENKEAIAKVRSDAEAAWIKGEEWISQELGYDTTETDANTVLKAAGFTPVGAEGEEKASVVSALIENKGSIDDLTEYVGQHSGDGVEATGLTKLVEDNASEITTLIGGESITGSVKNTVKTAVDGLANGAVKDNTDAIVILNGGVETDGSVANSIYTLAGGAKYNNELTLSGAISENTEAINDLNRNMVAAEAKLRNDIAALDSKVNDLDENLSAGIASSVALSAVEVSNVKKGEMSVGGGYGNYNSKSAMAFGATLGLTDNWSANAGVGFGFGKDTKASFRVGTNYKFKLF